MLEDQDSKERDLLLGMLVQRSLEVGGVYKLASGTSSKVYVDGKRTTCHAAAMPLVGRAFLRKMKLCGWKPRAVGGRTLGADPIAFSIARESAETIDAFAVRKETKEHGLKDGARAYIAGLLETKGLPVVIVDDVCTEGNSTGEAIEKSRNAGMVVLGAICLVDRQQGARELLESKYQCRLESIFTLPELLSRHAKSSPTAEPIGAHS